MIDIHCHILPGIDDGPKDMDETLAMLRVASADGVRTIVATPHYGGTFGEPAPDVIRAVAQRVNARAEDEAIPVSVIPGCEVQMHLDLPEQVASGGVLTLAESGRYVLVEVLPDPLPMYAFDVHFRLRTMGVTPILAHAERIAESREGLRFVRRFAEQEGLVQVNVESVSGELGWRVRRLCRRLFRENLAHIIGSDGHSTEWRPPVLTPCVRGFPGREPADVLGRYCSLDVGRRT